MFGGVCCVQEVIGSSVAVVDYSYDTTDNLFCTFTVKVCSITCNNNMYIQYINTTNEYLVIGFIGV